MMVNFDKFFEATDAGFIKADLGRKQELPSGGKTKKMGKSISENSNSRLFS